MDIITPILISRKKSQQTENHQLLLNLSEIEGFYISHDTYRILLKPYRTVTKTNHILGDKTEINNKDIWKFSKILGY